MAGRMVGQLVVTMAESSVDCLVDMSGLLMVVVKADKTAGKRAEWKVENLDAGKVANSVDMMAVGWAAMLAVYWAVRMAVLMVSR